MIPIPFMSIALFIFMKYARKETIEYYVINGDKEQAKELMKEVIQKQVSEFDN